MQWQDTAYAYPMVFAAVTSAFLTAYAVSFSRQKRGNSILVPFTALAASVTVWTTVSVVKLLLVDPTSKLTAYIALHVGAAAAPPAFLLFALAYTDRHEWVTRRTAALLYVVPLLFVLALVFNPNQLGYTGYEVFVDDGVHFLRVHDGPVSIFGLGYNIVVLLLALGVIAHYALRVSKPVRPQAYLLLGGMVVPLLVAAFELTHTPPLAGGVNMIPVSLAIPAAAFGVGVFRYRLLDLRPLAYAMAGEHSADGLIVLDTAETVVHVTDTVSTLLDTSDPYVGMDAASCVPLYDQLEPEGDPIDLPVPNAGDRFVELKRHTLTRAGTPVGWVVTVRDVTHRKQYELSLQARNAELEVFNRIVRHDIRNDMQLVTSYIDLVLEHEPLSETGRGQLNTAFRRAMHTVELTDVLGDLMRATDDADRVRHVNVADILTAAVEAIREGYPNATVSLSSCPRATVIANDLLDSVFENLLKNAVVHNDTENPTIDVSLSVTADTATVTISDDGPGIPDDRKERVFGEGERGIESRGTGIGLYLVKTIVSNFEGDVWVEDNDPRGSTFVVELPLVPTSQRPDVEVYEPES
ncbi:histidine kinase N-terminal 7TM domain-containing protein [Haloferax namakaokahaiae]|uniref:histidine kinase n=1 Tax=Haloferax namakaokahaiae TaxID=1748331 RepID=A0ABD5ZEN9_9EURY